MKVIVGSVACGNPRERAGETSAGQCVSKVQESLGAFWMAWSGIMLQAERVQDQAGLKPLGVRHIPVFSQKAPIEGAFPEHRTGESRNE
jgi:hypothetical protein